MRQILLIGGVAVFVLLSSFTVARAIDGNTGVPFSALWDAVSYLQNQITNIQLIPGPKGDTGPQGPTGPQGATGAGWDEQRFSNLEARVTALESVIPQSPIITLWDKFVPVSTYTESTPTDIGAYHNAQLYLQCIGDSTAGDCGFYYYFFDSSMNQVYYSGFIGISGGRTITYDIPIPSGAKFIRIDVSTPTGITTLNGTLTLT